jgi:hypothetical protein
VNSLVFYTGTLGFLAGVLIRSFVVVHPVLFLLCAGFGGVSLIGFFIFSRKYRLQLALGIFLIALSLGMFRFDQVDTVFKNDLLVPYANQAVDVLVRIVEEPDVRESSVRLVTDIVSLSDSLFVSPSRILVVTDLYPERKYGDVLRLRGVLK